MLSTILSTTSVSAELLQATIDSLPEPIFMKDTQHRWIGCNQAFCELLGHPREAIIGQSDPTFSPPEQCEVFWHTDDLVLTSGEPHENEEFITVADGSVHCIWTRKLPLRDIDGTVFGLSGIVTDITEVKRRQELVEQLETTIQEQSAIIDRQTRLLEQLAGPVIQIWKGILLLPLIGTISSQRATQAMQTMLTTIVRTRATVVILDITGVPIVDIAVANYLVQSIQAAQLLGCQSILVGISPDIAQTLVQLQVDFSHIITLATLQEGLADALKRLSYEIGSTRINSSGH